VETAFPQGGLRGKDTKVKQRLGGRDSTAGRDRKVAQVMGENAAGKALIVALSEG